MIVLAVVRLAIRVSDLYICCMLCHEGVIDEVKEEKLEL